MDVKTNNKIVICLEKGLDFHVERKTAANSPNKKGKVVVEKFSHQLAELFDSERRSWDMQTANYLLEQVKHYKPEKYAPGQPPIDVQLAVVLKAIELFKKKVLGSYWIWQKDSAMDKTIQEMEGVLYAQKIAEKFKIPFDYLIKNPKAVKLIKDNLLHYRIDNSYLERGMGPRMRGNKLCFYVNTRGPDNPRPRLVDWSKIKVDDRGKIQMNYGPHGFEDYKADRFVSLRPIKLVRKPESAPNGLRLELVTAEPVIDPRKIGMGFFGHSWLRVYVPEKTKIAGQETGREFVYSFGYDLKNLTSPDKFEFVPARKLQTTAVPISKRQWDELKHEIEQMNRAFQGEKVSDAEIMQTVEDITCGTCANFAAHIFGQVCTAKIDARNALLSTLFGNRVVKGVAKSFAKLLPKALSKKVSPLAGRISTGFFPREMVRIQKKLNRMLNPISK